MTTAELIKEIERLDPTGQQHVGIIINQYNRNLVAFMQLKTSDGSYLSSNGHDVWINLWLPETEDTYTILAKRNK